METHLLYSQFLSPFYLLPFVMAAGKRRRRKSSSSESSGETSFDASEEKKNAKMKHFWSSGARKWKIGWKIVSTFNSRKLGLEKLKDSGLLWLFCKKMEGWFFWWLAPRNVLLSEQTRTLKVVVKPIQVKWFLMNKKTVTWRMVDLGSALSLSYW